MTGEDKWLQPSTGNVLVFIRRAEGSCLLKDNGWFIEASPGVEEVRHLKGTVALVKVEELKDRSPSVGLSTIWQHFLWNV